MRWLIYLFMIVILASSIYAGEFIEITHPEDGVTYGPWSESYYFEEKTEREAHHLFLKVDIDQEAVAYYNVIWNNILMEYAGGQIVEDFNPGDSIVDFAPDDLEPLSFASPATTLSTFEVIAYDTMGVEIDRDTITFYLAVNIEDYFEILESEPEFESLYRITDEDLGKVEITREVLEESSEVFTLRKSIIYVTARDRFTDEVVEHTKVVITIIPEYPGKDLTLYSLIPKEVVDNVNEMVLEEDFVVKDPDPLMMWTFANVEETQQLTYHISKHLNSEEAEEIKMIAITEGGVEKSFIYYLIPIIAIPVILGIVIYFSRFQKR